MTARHQVRVGSRLGRGRSPIDAQPAPSVGELLQDARERKGVDLHRAERDTKIRAKHLAALENGDYDELPGTVYARGFLRNYALYLGLDAEEILGRWREEQDRAAHWEEPLSLPPQPLAEPKGHLRFTRGVFVGALLILVIAVFLGYVGVQLLRFSHAPVLTLDATPIQTLASDATTYTLSGSVDLPGAIVSVSGPSGFAQTTDADQDGRWVMQVPVTKGRNDFSVSARDPQLPPERGSAPLSVILTVPIPATPTPVAPPTSPAGSPAPTGSGGLPLPAAQVVITAPTDLAQLDAGLVAVAGTTDSTGVTISADYVGPAGQAPPSSPPDGSSGGPAATPVHVAVADGAFTGSISLGPGRWTLTATADGVPDALAPAGQSVTIDVVTSGLVLEIQVTGGPAWMSVIADGKSVEPGHTFKPGSDTTYTADQTIVVRTGNAGATIYVLNGRTIGALGHNGVVQTWQFEKGKQPKQL
jgi:cytoskeleton protein RodZ